MGAVSEAWGAWCLSPRREEECGVAARCGQRSVGSMVLCSPRSEEERGRHHTFLGWHLGNGRAFEPRLLRVRWCEWVGLRSDVAHGW